MKTTPLKLILATILTATTAHASQCILTGSMSGMTVAAGLDLDGDGNPARAGTLRARGGQFATVDAVVDTLLVGPCPGGIEIEPSGHAVFATSDGQHVVFTEIDSTHHLCTGALERVHLIVTGGRGYYAGASGTGWAEFPDDSILEHVGGYPRVIYTHGASYRLVVQR